MVEFSTNFFFFWTLPLVKNSPILFCFEPFLKCVYTDHAQIHTDALRRCSAQVYITSPYGGCQYSTRSAAGVTYSAISDKINPIFRGDKWLFLFYPHLKLANINLLMNF